MIANNVLNTQGSGNGGRGGACGGGNSFGIYKDANSLPTIDDSNAFTIASAGTGGLNGSGGANGVIGLQGNTN